MLKTRVVHKKSRRGQVRKVVREHYLRDDIPCGIEDCGRCPKRAGFPGLPLADLPESPSTAVEGRHLLVLDTSVLLSQLDVLVDPVFSHFLIPQTAWEEVKRRSPPTYKKMREWVGEGGLGKVFVNEFHMETFAELTEGESEAARQRRAVVVAASWLEEHLKALRLSVVLLSEEEESRSAAKDLGLQSLSLADYVGGMTSRPELAERLAAQAKSEESRLVIGKDKTLFPQHLSPAELQRGLKEGRLKQGSFQVDRENYLEGHVYVEGPDKTAEATQVLVKGLLASNRAINGDIVAIEILPKAEWTAPDSVLRMRDLEEKSEVAGVAEDDGVDAEEEEGKDEPTKKAPRLERLVEPTAKVVGIVRKNWRPYCGMLIPSVIPGSRRHLFSPAEKRIPRIRMETRHAEELAGQRLVVAIDGWPRDSRYPIGHLVRPLGPLGDRATENEVLLLENDIPHLPFAQEVRDCLPEMPWLITAADEAARKDLRHLDICSVDPPGCTDIDDALHCDELPNGNFAAGVHIADVSHFVRPDNAMDLEARMRGTTVYLVDQRIDMLPELLSSNLCSLRGEEERFAFSVLWELTPDGDVVSKTFHKSIIRSRAALTYQRAQDLILDTNEQGPVPKALRRLNALAKKLKGKRKTAGALSLASLEIRFNIDSETHDPIAVAPKKSVETTSMVEEWMLLANCTVAEHIYTEFPDCAVLRRHPVPPPSSYKPLVAAAAHRGFQLNVDSGKALAESLDRARIDGNPFFNTMLRMLATRSMTQALYFSSGTQEKGQFLHFGLASPMYTHFTSPIRRYADLLVHRLLAASIRADAPPPTFLDKKLIQDICNNLNYRHKNAQYAGRASVLLNTHLYFKDKREELEGYVLLIRHNALQVLVPKYGLECPILTSKCPAFTFDAESNSMDVAAADGPTTIRLFDRVRVQLFLDDKDQQHLRLRLALVVPDVPDFSVPSILQ